eukprot:TRINITY_DN75489_c0_g1_i1.p1 TRINITY_DN75489_c0_g1~~TRINITY_DN75489_c0_g1_i1.p1  ORF type:complete len:266 (-),score=27.00 TRINITY_DN75489_c0_g1_i1:171-968(-)
MGRNQWASRGTWSPAGPPPIKKVANKPVAQASRSSSVSLASGIDDVAVSKYLAYVLRHGGAQTQVQLRSDGYACLREILALDFFSSRGLTERDIRALVNRDPKKRYGLCTPDGEDELHIRAHQGHTVRDVEDKALLTEIESAEGLEFLCHGTFAAAWETIKLEGLKPMARNHIHCVDVDLAHPENHGVHISGSRGESEVIVYIDAQAAIDEGVQFLRSENGVVLTEGLSIGGERVLPEHLFSGICTWDYNTNCWTYSERPTCGWT